MIGPTWRRTSVVTAALALSVAAVAGCGGGSTQTIPSTPAADWERAPYLTRVTRTGARLAWIAPEGARVALTATAPDGAAVTALVRAFSGLRPDTRYAWTATLDGREAARGSFTTAPRDLSRPLELVVFGDYGAPNDSSRAVVALTERQRPRLLVTAGDNSYLVTLPDLIDDTIFRPMRAVLAGAPNYGVVGDHDVVFPAGQAALVEAFEWPGRGERYELRYGPLQIVAVGLAGTRADVAFARRALARPGPLARLLVMHQPLKPGSPLLPVIADADVTAVLAGHLHAYERRELAEAPGVPFFTVGTGGAPRNDGRTPRSPEARVHLAEFGLMRVRLEATRATYEFVDLDGRVRDRSVWPLAR